MPAASHSHEPEPTSSICVSWKDHGFSLSLLVFRVISFSCTISKCFLFNVFHTAVCFATCFPILLKPKGSGCVCHFRTWISLGGVFFSYSAMGEFATGDFFLLLLPGKNTIEQSPSRTACFPSCHTAIFSFKKQKANKYLR